jgi:hypothetical protein
MKLAIASRKVSEVQETSAMAPRALHFQRIRAQRLRKPRRSVALAMARAIG